MRTAWFFVALLASATLAVVHVVANATDLYWTYRWLDIPMHILGGFALGSLVIAILMRHRPGMYVLAMLAVAFGWELFEVLIGMPRPTDYPLDTLLDLFDDGVGALMAYLLARRTLWRSV